VISVSNDRNTKVFVSRHERINDAVPSFSSYAFALAIQRSPLLNTAGASEPVPHYKKSSRHPMRQHGRLELFSFRQPAHELIFVPLSFYKAILLMKKSIKYV
jgi:hypothetical protein